MTAREKYMIKQLNMYLTKIIALSFLFFVASVITWGVAEQCYFNEDCSTTAKLHGIEDVRRMSIPYYIFSMHPLIKGLFIIMVASPPMFFVVLIIKNRLRFLKWA